MTISIQKPSVRRTVLGAGGALAITILPIEPASAQYAGAPGGNTIWLDQGWSDFDRDWYYFQTQGSEIMSYSFFLNLEQAHSERPFRDNEHLADLGFAIALPSENNPDGLPIGFTQDAYRDQMGVSCAACHNGEMTYQGTRIIVDGGAPLANFPEFMKRLSAAMDATLNDPQKFDRFARHVLGPDYGPDNAIALRRDFEAQAAVRRNYVERQYPGAVTAGYGRLDAINGIFNEVLRMTGVPGNRVNARAPTSYPHIWDTPRMDFVQYDGDVANIGMGSLLRNVGEVVGVFGNIDVTADVDIMSGYPSSVRVHDLAAIEETLRDLTSPEWPEVFPEIDMAKAKRGEKLYTANCLSCHAVIEHRDPDRRIVRPQYRPELVGTDTARLEAVRQVAPMGVFAGRKELFSEGREMQAEDYVVSALGHVQMGVIQASLDETLAEKIVAEAPFDESHVRTGDFNTATAEDPLAEFWAYGARPLNGVWATAPFLNNGSVPNLYQLLTPADQRVKNFYIRSREFDPVNVGYDTSEQPGAFLYEATLPGNLNTGHEFGTDLSDEERWELIEYLKTL